MQIRFHSPDGATSLATAVLIVILNEAKTSRPRSRPRPELRGRGQFLEVEAKTEAKNNYEKVPNNDK